MPKIARRPILDRIIRILKVLRQTWITTRTLGKLEDSLSDEGRKISRQIQQEWAVNVIKHLGIKVNYHGVPLEEPCLYVSNHMGFIDIPLLMSVLNASFVAKMEVKKWPLVGKGAASANTLFVKRSSAESRHSTARTLGRFITTQQQSVTIFPEGTSSSHGKPWKMGSFAIAKEYGFKVQPLRVAYRPHRICCYIISDTFVPTLWRLLSRLDLEADVEFLSPRTITDIETDARLMEKQVHDSLFAKLREWNLSLEPYHR